MPQEPPPRSPLVGADSIPYSTSSSIPTPISDPIFKPIPDDNYFIETGCNNSVCRSKIDMQFWDDYAKPTDSESFITTTAIYFMYQAAEEDLLDNYLDGDFFETFERWDVDAFKKIDKGIRTKLKDFLQRRGVYVDYGKHKTLPKAFWELLQGDKMPQWPPHKAAGMRFDPRSIMASGKEYYPRTKDPELEARVRDYYRELALSVTPKHDKAMESAQAASIDKEFDKLSLNETPDLVNMAL